MKYLPAALLVLSVCVSCATYQIEPPDGFAVIEGRDTFRAISPEGVKMRLRFEPNDPQQDLDFWAAALRNHLERGGFRPIGGKETFLTGEWEGVIFEWGAPVGGEDYLYLTAIVPTNKRICIIEVAGEHSLYREYRESIGRSLRTLTLR